MPRDKWSIGWLRWSMHNSLHRRFDEKEKKSDVQNVAISFSRKLPWYMGVNKAASWLTHITRVKSRSQQRGLIYGRTIVAFTWKLVTLWLGAAANEGYNYLPCSIFRENNSSFCNLVAYILYLLSGVRIMLSENLSENYLIYSTFCLFLMQSKICI